MNKKSLVDKIVAELYPSILCYCYRCGSDRLKIFESFKRQTSKIKSKEFYVCHVCSYSECIER
jgi:hypothetical protein